jgi:uncharacterized protein
MLRLPDKAIATGLRVLVFALLAIVGTIVFAWALMPAGYLVTSALSVFLAATVANAIAIRIYDQGSLAGVGFPWNRGAVRNLLLGIGGGVGAAVLILGGALITGSAHFEASQTAPAQSIGASLFLTVVLLFGAAGEEMLFRGYAFQVLLGALGPFATILPISMLFALAHSGNLNVTFLGLVNTFGWGVVLGYAFLRSGDLWLPIGLHFGWNWALPLFGVNLSGFTMSITGYAMRWTVGPLWSGGDYGPEGGLVTTLVIFLLITWLVRAPVRRQTPFLLRGTWEEL